MICTLFPKARPRRLSFLPQCPGRVPAKFVRHLERPERTRRVRFEEADPRGRERPSSLRPKRVLVVDDDAATRTGLAELLEQGGYQCTAVGTFDEARQLLRVMHPDLLITDIRLREYNGLQLLLNSPHPVAAIVISGYADPVLEAEARRSGAGYLLKPVDPAELEALVREKLRASNELQAGT